LFRRRGGLLRRGGQDLIATAHKLLARIYVVLKEGRPFEVR
jgi:hypothetical protein